MIKLTVNPDKHPHAITFDKTVVVIGAPGQADLSLQDEKLEAVHVKIQEQEGQYSIVNQANDPFVTLNGLPFGKKFLKNNDTIQIGNTLIRFDSGTPEKPVPKMELADTGEKLEQILDKVIEAKAEEDKVELEDFVQNMEESDEDEELADRDIDTLISQVEDLQTKVSKDPLTGSLKDDYLVEYEDNGGKQKEKTPPQEPQPRWNWRLIGLIVGLILLILFFLSGIFYLHIDKSNVEEELKAAEGIADISMALTYAQMHHIKPQNLNWVDPEFLKNNLSAVLAPEYAPAFSLDSHGQFNNNNYLIRIYTSSDLSQFIIIAQPAAGLLQWLVPKSTISVDSRKMELRKIHDLRVLNRLLLNPNPLEGNSSKEISNLVREGGVIDLLTLSSKSEKHGFQPPKALALMRPGSENFIYNAPRYYRFGEAFLKQALMLTESPSDSQEVELLQKDIHNLASFPQMVLYTSYGMQWAVQAQKALNAFVPKNKMLIAYLKFNSKGTLASSHLLMDQGNLQDSNKEIAAVPKPLASKTKKQVPAAKSEPAEDVQKIDSNHPLYLQLCALKSDLQKPLLMYEYDLSDLLETPDRVQVLAFLGRMEKILKKSLSAYDKQPAKLEKANASYQFFSKLRKLLEKYDQDQKEQNENTLHALTKLYQEYSNMPLEKFIDYIKAAELETFVKERLKLNDKEQIAQSSLPSFRINKALEKIQAATTISELKTYVDEVSNLLSLEKFQDPKKIVTYQSEVRMSVIERLNDFLLSSTKSLPQSEFQEENRAVLAHILKSAWVTDPDEFEFYINEFEVRAHPKVQGETPKFQRKSADGI